MVNIFFTGISIWRALDGHPWDKTTESTLPFTIRIHPAMKRLAASLSIARKSIDIGIGNQKKFMMLMEPCNIGLEPRTSEPLSTCRFA